MLLRNRAFILTSILGIGASLSNVARADPVHPGFIQLFMPVGGASIDLPGIGDVSLSGKSITGQQSDNGDFATTLLDAFAVAVDVLGQYQAQIAAEGYLGTANQRFSAQSLGLHTSGFFDVFVALNCGSLPNCLIPQADPLPSSTGLMTVHQTTGGSGTLDIVLDVYADLLFVDAADQTHVISQPLPKFTLTATGVPWVEASGDSFGSYPTTGIFLPQGISFTSSESFFSGPNFLPADIPAAAPVPEPTSVFLLGAVMILLAALRLKQRSRPAR